MIKLEKNEKSFIYIFSVQLLFIVCTHLSLSLCYIKNTPLVQVFNKLDMNETKNYEKNQKKITSTYKIEILAIQKPNKINKLMKVPKYRYCLFYLLSIAYVLLMFLC